MTRLRTVIATLVALTTLMVVLGPTGSAAPSQTLMFAVWNVCKIDCAAPAPSWAVRRDRVVKTVAEAEADVLALNEATDWAYGAGTQWDDIQRLLAPHGLVAPKIEEDLCRSMGCTHSARLMFSSRSVQQVSFDGQPSAGYARVMDIAAGVPMDGDRQVTWAYLRGTPGTDVGPFLVVSVHLSTVKSSAGEQHRVMFGRAVQSWAAKLNAARGLPGAATIVMGDFNSTETRNPRGVQFVMQKSGWTDAITAPTRTNIRINSINYTPEQRTGWPMRPIYNKWRRASRIDYIMMRGPVKPLTYEVVVHTNADGTFDKAYQASDHLMVRSRLRFA